MDGLKLALVFLLFFIGLAGVLLPTIIKSKHRRISSLGNMFSAGVLLSAAIVHELADASTTSLNSGKFPVANFVCGVSFILLLIIEEVGHGHDHSEDHATLRSQLLAVEHAILSTDDVDHTHGHPHGHSHGYGTYDVSGPSENAHSKDFSIPPPLRSPIGSQDAPCSPGGHHHDNEHLKKHLHASGQSVIMFLVALVFHSMLLGFSIGVPNNGKLLSLVIAVFAHKFFAAYSLGGAVASVTKEWIRTLKFATLFAVSTPLGMLVGMFMPSSLTSTSVWNDYISGAISALVAGVFLYISIVEIGTKEILSNRNSEKTGKSKSDTGMKLLFYALGFCAMSSIALVL